MAEDEPLRFEMDRLVSYDEEALVQEMQRVASLLPPGPITRDAFEEMSRVHSTTLIRRFGGWEAALDRADLGARYGGKRISAKMRDQRARTATAEDMIQELQRIADLLGTRTVTRADLLTHSHLVGERAVINRFGSWKSAIEASGLELSRMAHRWTDDDYFDNLLDVWTHYGKRPTFQQMNRSPSRISGNGYAAKFGTWLKAVAAFVERVNSDIARSEQEFHEATVPEPIEARPAREDLRHIPVGLRYQVLRRDRFRCVICGRSPATDLECNLHVDHMVAFSRGGKTRLDNLRSLCVDCNLGKGAKD